jgi:hypothetical protein
MLLGGSGASAQEEYMRNLLALLPSDLSALERQRMEWALDGSAESSYPELDAELSRARQPAEPEQQPAGQQPPKLQ